MNKAAGLTLDIKSTFMLLLLAAVWGGSFFFGEVALSEVPPLTITLHRVVWAVPILALIVVLNGIAIPKSPSVWGAYLVMGALNNAIPFSLIFWGQTQIASGLASILNGTTAMFAAVVAGFLLIDEPLTARKIISRVSLSTNFNNSSTLSYDCKPSPIAIRLKDDSFSMTKKLKFKLLRIHPCKMEEPILPYPTKTTFFMFYLIYLRPLSF